MKKHWRIVKETTGTTSKYAIDIGYRLFGRIWWICEVHSCNSTLYLNKYSDALEVIMLLKKKVAEPKQKTTKLYIDVTDTVPMGPTTGGGFSSGSDIQSS